MRTVPILAALLRLTALEISAQSLAEPLLAAAFCCGSLVPVRLHGSGAYSKAAPLHSVDATRLGALWIGGASESTRDCWKSVKQR